MAKKKPMIQFRHSGIENVVLLGLILAFFIILAPLVYTHLPASGAGPKYDVITGLAVSSTMDSDVTNAIIVVLAIAFLIPVELMLRERGKKAKKIRAKRVIRTKLANKHKAHK